MSRRKNNKPTKIAGQFAWRLIAMLESPAYRVLSLSAHRVLARLEIELASHGGADNGNLPTTFDQFEEYGIHRHAISPALRELVALGFLEVTERGRAGNAEWRRPSVYRLKYRPTASTEPTDDWRNIATVERANAIAETARKDKSQWRKTHQKLVRKPHRSGPVLGAETTTTSHSAETTTTSISREGTGTGEANGARPIEGQAQPGATSADAAEKEIVQALGGWEKVGSLSASLFEAMCHRQASERQAPGQPKAEGAMPLSDAVRSVLASVSPRGRGA